MADEKNLMDIPMLDLKKIDPNRLIIFPWPHQKENNIYKLYKHWKTRQSFKCTGLPDCPVCALYENKQYLFKRRNNMESAQALEHAIKGAMWLEKIIQDNGRIIYGYNCKTLKQNKDYNILRHAGSIWAMLSVYEYIPIITMLESATRSLEYIKNEYSGKMDGLSVIHEDGWIKLGGNALVSMAMLKCYQMHVKNAEQLEGGIIDISKSNWLLDFGVSLVAYMFKCIDPETNLFTHHKRNVNTGADKGFNSSFYPGEALLAIITAYDVVLPDGPEEKPTTLLQIQKVITAYFVLRETDGHVRDHWMIQAIEKIIPYSDQELISTVLLPYAESIKGITINDNPSGSAGASAARTESLLAYMRIRIATADKTGYPGKRNLMKIIANQLDFQASCFVNRGISEGAFRANPKTSECRCDCTQHNISSFLGYHKLVKG